MLTNPWQPTLHGEHIRLRPLREDDFAALHAAASDPAIWAQHPQSDRWREAVFRNYFDSGMAGRGCLVIEDAQTGAVIGSSRYHGHDPVTRTVEIGWTFLTRSHWGGATNAELKRLMLDHAFQLVNRVIFKVGVHNQRSQRALLAIGARWVGPDPTTPDGANAVYEIWRPGAPGAPARFVLSEAMRRTIEEQRLGLVASVDEDGSPAVSPKGTFAVLGEDRIGFLDIRSPNSVRNLRARPRVEVVFVDPFARSGWRFKGLADVVLPDDPLWSAMLDAFARYGDLVARARHIVTIQVERALTVRSPAYDGGAATEADLRASWARHFAALQPGGRFEV
jgi:RimJ/RimL family protein N-acetyltransferase/general stress protein 26